MKQITKQQLQTQIVEEVDDMFAADDWDGFKIILYTILERLSGLKYRFKNANFMFIHMHTLELGLLERMYSKFVLNEKVATKKATRDAKSTFANLIQYSEMPGEAFRHDELSQLVRYHTRVYHTAVCRHSRYAVFGITGNVIE